MAEKLIPYEQALNLAMYMKTLAEVQAITQGAAQRAETAEGEKAYALGFEISKTEVLEELTIHLPEIKLESDGHSDKHSDEAENDGGDHKAAHRFVVIDNGRGGGTWLGSCGCGHDV